MDVVLDSKIRLCGVPEALRKQIMAELTLDNPEYEKKRRMGLPLWGVQKEIRLYEQDGHWLILPRGYYARLYTILNDSRICISGGIEDNRLRLSLINFPGYPLLRDYQEPAVPQAMNWTQGCVIMPCGGGKGHPLKTKICTPDGWVELGNLSVGDKVIGSDGKPCLITGIYDRGVLSTYKVTFSDDTSILCDKDHIWTVQSQCVRNTTGNWITKTTKELLKGKLYCGTSEKHNRKKWFIPIVSPVQYASRDIVIDPYFLGVWLGDGSGKNGRELHITNAEIDIIEKISKVVKLSQYEYNEFGVIDAADYKKEMVALGLYDKKSHEKFIPGKYLYNSSDVRLSVLQGLMDTDGSVEETDFNITTTSERMAYEILDIVQSLGGTGKIVKRQTFYNDHGVKRAGLPSYRLYFKLYDFLPFTSDKHKAKHLERMHYKKAYRAIKSIDYVGEMPIRCISVDAADSLYVAENYIVTHNTETGMAIAASIRQPTLWITHTMDLLKQSMDRAISRLKLAGDMVGLIQAENMKIGTHMTFATVQTLAKRDLTEIVNKFGCIIVDEAHLVFKDAAKARMFESVLSQFPAYYRFGLTASEHRSDGLINTMFQIIGPKVYEVDQDDPRLKTVKPRVQFIETDFDFHMDTEFQYNETTGQMEEKEEMLNVQQLYQAMRENALRDRIILQILALQKPGDSTLALGHSLEHLENLLDRLSEYLGSKYEYRFISGETRKKDREKAIEDMREGRAQFLFATYQLAKLGLDIPRLNQLVLATPVKDKTSVQQAVGRIMRPFDGKGVPVVYDIWDKNIKQMNFWARERVRMYRNLGCSIDGGPKVRK